MSGTLRLRGAISGYSELQAASVAGDQTFILPTAGGTLLTTDSPVPQLTLQLGSASEPSLRFEGDTDTGLYSQGANTLNLVTGGSSKVILGADAHTIYAGTGASIRAVDIDSSGNVGVGTSSPDYLVDIRGAQDDTTNFVFNGLNLINTTNQGAVSNKTAIRLGVTSDSGVRAAKVIAFEDGNNTHNVGLGFDVNSTNAEDSTTRALTILSDGNVGIGTTSPDHKLHVVGTNEGGTFNALELLNNTTNTAGTATVLNMPVFNGATGFRITSYGNATDLYDAVIATGQGSANLRFNSSNNQEGMRLDSSGRLLVGTTSANTQSGISAAKLQVLGGLLVGTDDAGTNGSGYIAFASACNSPSDSRPVIYHHQGVGLSLKSDANISFEVGADEKVRIDSAGNIGIGTTSPSGVIHIKADTDDTTLPSIVLEDSGTTSTRLGSITNRTGDIHLASTASLTDIRSSIVLSDSRLMTFNTNNIERLRIDSSGDLLLGTTSSSAINTGPFSGATPKAEIKLGDASNSYSRLINISNPGAETGAETLGRVGIKLSLGSEANSGNSNKSGLIYAESTSTFNNSTSLCFGTSNTERMRIDSSGRLMLANTNASGMNSAMDNFVLGSGSGSEGMTIYSGNTSSGFIGFNDAVSATTPGVIGYDHNTNSMEFRTSDNQRISITSDGATKMTTTNDYFSTNSLIYEMRNNNIGNWIAYFTNTTGSNPYGLSVRYPSASPNDTASDFYHAEDSTATRFRVRSNGGVENFSSNNANLCDEREKKNIVSLDAKWDTVKDWELKKFHYNEDADTDDLRYGVIAQQVETVCPEVLTEWEKQSAAEAELDKEGNVVTPAKEQIMRKGVKEQQMMWIAIKALQEAQNRIETLEANNLSLENRIAALENN
jgi:hypothetical protein